MADIHLEVDIKSPPETVFDTLADIVHYDRWLAPSGTYNTTTNVSDNVVRAGTTYVDHNSGGVLYGQVREYKPYSRLVFHQATKRKIIGLDVTIRYELTRTDEGTHLERTTSMTPLGLLRLLAPMVIGRTRTENQRTLDELKYYLEEGKSGRI
ncbi:MAG TPA: SRPBCC domain-containing protein [Phototrophicaceae bacterium]|nr:SRPBCC domain-containing protein [Phototrophicaceae bacterium]